MSGSTFTSNSASTEAAASSTTATATVSGSTFTSNSAVDGGGGLVQRWDGDGERQHLHQQLRRRFGGGGIVNELGGTATVSDSTFTSNSASIDGGGLVNSGTATVSGSTFTSNSASTDGGGLATTVRRR